MNSFKDLFRFAVTLDQKTHTDLFKYLLMQNTDGTLTVDPLVLDAIAMAIYNWQTTQARSTYKNDQLAINLILGRDTKTEIEPHEWAVLSDAGAAQAAVIDNLGKEIFDLLGFAARDDVDGAAAPRLQLALGEMALAYLYDSNVVEQVEIDNKIFPESNDQFEQAKETGAKDITIFTRVKDGAREKIDLITDNHKESTISETLFGMDSYKTFPSMKPSEKVPTLMKRTTQKIAEVTRKLLAQQQKDEWEVRTQVSDKLFSVSESLRNNILGVVEDIEAEHVTNRKSVEAQNDRIQRTLDDFQEFIGKLKTPDAPFFMKYFVSRVGRLFIDNNTINPLQNETIRHLIGLKHYNVTVDGTELRQQYKLAIAQAFGVPIDKQSMEKSLKAFNEILASTADAVDALRSDTLTAKQETLVKEALKGKEGIRTFEALLSLRDYSVTEPFHTNIAIETDAVTSGVAIGMMQSLLDSAEDRLSVGVRTDGNTESYAEWRGQPGHFDLYEKLAMAWTKHIANIEEKDPSLVPTSMGIKNLLGDFGTVEFATELGRKFSKDPLMITNYGSAVKNALYSLGSKVISSFYSKLVKADNPETVYREMADILGLKYDPKVKESAARALGVPLEMKPQDFVLSHQQETALREAVRKTYGAGLSLALKERLGRFMTFRDNINKAFQVMFYAFEAKFIKELAKKKQELKRNLSIKEQEEVLESIRPYFPVAKGVLSEGLDDAILIIKGGLRRQYPNKKNNYSIAYRNQQQYGRPLKNTRGTKYLSSFAKAYEFLNPGAAAAVSQIHNLDSAINQAMLKAFEAMNIHDAGNYNLGDVIEGTKEANKAFLELNMSHSIFQETWDSYHRILELAQNDSEIAKDFANALDNVFRPSKKEGNAAEQRDAFEKSYKEMLYEVQDARTEFDESDVISINNVSHEDTVYVRTQRNKAQTKEEYEKIEVQNKKE
jgi:hypothetical protein